MSGVERHRLTRALLLQLPDGCGVVSNVCDSAGRPIFASFLTGDTLRRAVWEAACAANADQRLCVITKNPELYAHFCGASVLDRAAQLSGIAETGDDDNAECAAADLAREFPNRT